jgi:hypothetical protein
MSYQQPPVSPLDPMTSLTLELGRPIEMMELLEWFVDGLPQLSWRCGEVLRRTNVDLLLSSLEATLSEKIAIQSDVYDKLERMLSSGDNKLCDQALDILTGSSSRAALELLLRFGHVVTRPA